MSIGAFGTGTITFANFAFPAQLPVQFEVDADRVQGGHVVVTLSNGSIGAARSSSRRTSV